MVGLRRHEIQDANWLAANEIDWWKEDSCDLPPNETGSVDAIEQYAKMRDALNATGMQSGKQTKKLREMLTLKSLSFGCRCCGGKCVTKPVCSRH